MSTSKVNQKSATLTHLCFVYGYCGLAMAELSHWGRGPQSLKYLFSGSLHKQFVDPYSRFKNRAMFCMLMEIERFYVVLNDYPMRTLQKLND